MSNEASGKPARDQAVAQLRRYTERYEATGDAREILGDAALATARNAMHLVLRVVNLSGGELRSTVDTELAIAIGMFFWCRSTVTDVDDGDREVALEFFGMAHRADPRALPEPVRGLLLDSDDHDDASEEGEQQGRSPVEVIAAGTVKYAVQHGVQEAVAFLLARLPSLLNAASDDTLTQAFALNEVGSTLAFRADTASPPIELDLAVAMLRAAIALRPEDDSLAPVRGNYALALRIRFERRGDPQDLDEAILVARAAAQLAADPDERGVVLIVLSGALLLSSERGDDPMPLEESIAAALEARRLVSPDHPHRPTVLNTLGLVLRQRFSRTGDVSDLNAAAEAGTEAVIMAAPGIEGAGILANLACTLRMRYERLGDPSDLDEAFELVRDAVSLAAGHPQSDYLKELGAVLLRRFELHGDFDDIDAAVTALQRAVDGTPEHYPRRADWETDLSLALQKRFELFGEETDINAAVTWARQAVERTPEQYPEFRRMLSQLSLTLGQLFSHTHNHGDADAAIEAARRAVAITPVGHPDRPRYLHNLAVVLLQRWWEVHRWMTTTGSYHGFTLAFDPGDLDEAVAVAQGSVDALPEDHPVLLSYRSTLSAALRAKYTRTGDDDDGQRAIAVSRDVVASTTDDHPRRYEYLANLGTSLVERFHRASDSPSGREAITVLSQVATDQRAPTWIRARAAKAWGETAAALEDWPLAARGFSVAVELLPLLVWRGLAPAERGRLLSEVAGLPSQAAACAIAIGQPERAVELLEQGRGVLLTEMTAANHQFEELLDQHPAIADRMVRVHAALNAPRDPDDWPLGLTAAHTYHEGEQRRALAHEWDELVAQVREFDEFTDFLCPPTYAQLRDVAADGPIVMVNVSRYRSDALIMTTDKLHVIGLDDLTLPALIERALDFLHAVEEPASLSSRVAVAEACGWLWDTIAEPVLDALGLTEPPPSSLDWPRIWWCPTGPLAFLPLHAAGHPATSDDSRSSALIDRAISSYAPTLRALSDARRRNGSIGSLHPLVVAAPETPGLRDLPHTSREARLVAERLPDPLVLIGAEASCHRVLTELRHSRIAHFACHGYQDAQDLSGGFLALPDGKVTLFDLAQLRPRDAAMAFLSACDAARGVGDMPDESLHLGGALHLVGYSQVIATAWSITDELAADLSAQVYARLRLSESDAAPLLRSVAPALHAAVRELRDTHRNDPMIWAAYLHIGP